MPDIDDVLDWSERIGNIIGNLLSLFLIVQLFGDLLGINIFEAIRIVVTRPWVIPTEWIVMYYPLWYGMEWGLLILMLADQVYTMRYMQIRKSPPPPTYERYMSLAIFMVSFWLTLIFHYTSLLLITILSAITFSYTMFARPIEA